LLAGAGFISALSDLETEVVASALLLGCLRGGADDADPVGGHANRDVVGGEGAANRRNIRDLRDDVFPLLSACVEDV
jgi:hypothetical protein